MTGAEYQVAVIGGDGIGPEVTREALKVARAAAEVYGFRVGFRELPHGSEHYLATGELLPDAVFEEMRGMDAIYLGAIGDPRVQEVGLVEREIILRLRFGLDLYINLRPIRLYAEHLCPLKGKGPADVDMLVVRENTEGAYSQIGGHLRVGTPHEIAITNAIYTRFGVERAVRYAFEQAMRRRRKLTLVDKANAIRTHDLWARVFEVVGAEYPDVERDHAYVDAACMWLVKKPEWFDVIVTTNLFGDIITDLGAEICGGMGIAASGNIHPGRVSLFEPVHGSAPKYKGQNKVNPLAAILAVGMMLDHLGQAGAAVAVEGAVADLLVTGRIRSLAAGAGPSTSEVGDMVVEGVRAGAVVREGSEG